MYDFEIDPYPMPPWSGPGYWPPAPAIIPSPRHQRRGQDYTCYPGERRVYASDGDFWCESTTRMRPRRFAGLDETSMSGADLVRALLDASRLAPDYKKRIVGLYNAKALTNATYLLYRTWVANQVRLREHLTDLMRRNNRLADAVARELGTSRSEAISRVENMRLDNVVYTERGFQGLGVAPVIALGVAGIVSLAGYLTISRIAAQDVEVARENTRRLDRVLKAAEEATKNLPPEKRIAAIKAVTDSAAQAFTPPAPGILDQIRAAIAKPVGLAIGAGLVYFGATKVVIPYLRKRKMMQETTP
jgi:hypothetical protein